MGKWHLGTNPGFHASFVHYSIRIRNTTPSLIAGVCRSVAITKIHLMLDLRIQYLCHLRNRYRGFDKYLGLPYSVDMGCTDDHQAHDKSGPHICKAKQGPTNHAAQLPLPLYQSNSPNCTGQTSHTCNGDIIQAPVNFTTLRSTSSQSFVQYQNHKIELAPAHLPRSNYL